DSLAEVSKIAGRRQLSIDPLLPDLGDPPEGCSPPLIARGPDGRLIGFGICGHHVIPDDSLDHSFGMATRFVLTARLGEPDVRPALDLLLGDAGALLRETAERCEQALPPGDPLTRAVQQGLADIGKT